MSFLLLLAISISKAQQADVENDVKKVIITFFEGFHQKDTLLMKYLVSDDIHLQSIIVSPTNENVLSSKNFEDFLISIATIPEEVKFEEKLHSYTISVYGVLATVSTPYTFYLNDIISHCGVNIFQLYLDKNKWKIVSIMDSRQKDNCY
ncbi:MAG: 3-methyl-2-oxobutanoate hydroxymethyltransferase [Bacteroidetes bacterium HGW-Bacteroidetes-2]|nr:MAG: 3-methyl-2-oxobutanoate hydroxymethyltransferase [Bacteroidetes bacterium HGW-Bacteroidetes-2]